MQTGNLGDRIMPKVHNLQFVSSDLGSMFFGLSDDAVDAVELTELAPYSREYNSIYDRGRGFSGEESRCFSIQSF